MLYNNYIQVIIPIIGLITAIISAALSYYFTKKKELERKEKRLKEEYYFNYINALSELVVSSNNMKSLDKVADAQNKLLLVGSVKVVANLMKFHDYVKPSSIEKNGFSSEEHDKLLTELLKSMREDLYSKKKVNVEYPIIHLTGKTPSK